MFSGNYQQSGPLFVFDNKIEIVKHNRNREEDDVPERDQYKKEI